MPTLPLALMGIALFGTLSGGVTLAATPASTPASSSTANCPLVLQHRFDRLQDEKPQSLCQYAGQVVLVVNTASYCGFTGQYKGLEALYSKYKGQGLVVLGFPSHDFSQEPDSNGKIAEFCESTFGVKFPMFTKSHVTGAEANPLFQQLAQRSGSRPKWNFYKYLISRDGQRVTAYSSFTSPDDPALLKDIEKQLMTK